MAAVRKRCFVKQPAFHSTHLTWGDFERLGRYIVNIFKTCVPDLFMEIFGDARSLKMPGINTVSSHGDELCYYILRES